MLTRDEIVAAFTLERVTPSAAIFDEKKLEWLNGEWIRRLTLDELVDRLAPFVAARLAHGIDAATPARRGRDRSGAGVDARRARRADGVPRRR